MLRWQCVQVIPEKEVHLRLLAPRKKRVVQQCDLIGLYASRRVLSAEEMHLMEKYNIFPLRQHGKAKLFAGLVYSFMTLMCDPNCSFLETYVVSYCLYDL